MAKGRSGSKGSLRTALVSQQSRLQKKEKAKQAAQNAELRAKHQASGAPRTKTKKGARAPGARRRTTVPFAATDRILLVGEGNFSFARALLANPPTGLEFLPAANVTATGYDTEEECYSKYPESKEIVAELRQRGATVLFAVDATRLEKCTKLKTRKFDRVMWNFPHAGKGIADQDRNILSNQVLILGFLRSAPRVLVEGPIPVPKPSKKKKAVGDEEDEEDVAASSEEEDEEDSIVPKPSSRGTVLITLRNVAPYTLWDVPKLAKSPPAPQAGGPSTSPNPRYKLLRSFAFHRDAWAGYEHRMTKGERAGGTGKTGEGGEDRTWEFCLAEASAE